MSLKSPRRHGRSISKKKESTLSIYLISRICKLTKIIVSRYLLLVLPSVFSMISLEPSGGRAGRPPFRTGLQRYASLDNFQTFRDFFSDCFFITKTIKRYKPQSLTKLRVLKIFQKKSQFYIPSFFIIAGP